MPYKKGQSGNPEGRKRGTPNRTTEQIRTAIHEMIDENFDLIKADFIKLDPEKRTKFYIDLLKMVLPAPISIEKLTESQLDELYQHAVKKYAEPITGMRIIIDNEQISKD